jgi:predicted Holliday junction resolvase-like endonuclease
MGIAELIAGVGIVVTVIFALHQITAEKINSLDKIVADRINNLQTGWDKEAERLRENTNKTETRLGETTLRAETKMKEEADKVREQFLANNSTIKNEMDIRFRECNGKIDGRIKKEKA